MQEQTAHMRSMILHPSAPRGKVTISSNRKSAKLKQRSGVLLPRPICLLQRLESFSDGSVSRTGNQAYLT